MLMALSSVGRLMNLAWIALIVLFERRCHGAGEPAG